MSAYYLLDPISRGFLINIGRRVENDTMFHYQVDIPTITNIYIYSVYIYIVVNLQLHSPLKGTWPIRRE